MEGASMYEALGVVVMSGCLWSWEIRYVEFSCLMLCREVRQTVAREITACQDTPRTLWCPLPPNALDAGGGRSRDGTVDVVPGDDLEHALMGSFKSTRTKKGASKRWAKPSRVRSRIPEVRITSILWRLPIEELRTPGFRWPKCIEKLNLETCTGSLRGIPLPDSVKDLSLGPNFNSPIVKGEIVWPGGLRRLRFESSWDGSPETSGCMFNQPLRGVEWPPKLESLVFTRRFNQPLVGVSWPPGLRYVCFGEMFDQDISLARFPDSLEDLLFGKSFSHPLQEGDDGPTFLPRGLRVLRLGDGFEGKRIGAKTLPDGLEVLLCEGCTFSPGMQWPSMLETIDDGTFSDSNHSLPPGLKSLSVRGACKGWLEHVVFPPTLTELDFGPGFNAPFHSAMLPDGLRELRFGVDFNQDIRGVRLPRELKLLSFAGTSPFNRLMVGIEWPPNLEDLRFGKVFNRPLSSIPPRLKRLCLGSGFLQPLTAVNIPRSLEYIRIDQPYPTSKMEALLLLLNFRGQTWSLRETESNYIVFERRVRNK